MQLILEYFAPGSIGCVVFLFFASKKLSKQKYFMIHSIVYSYLLRAAASLLRQLLFPQIVLAHYEKVFILCVFAVMVSIAAIKIYESRAAKFLMNKINHKSLHANIWDDYVDTSGTSAHIVLNSGKVLRGKISGYEENGINSWVALKDSTLISEDEVFIKNKNTLAANFNEMTLIKMSDIEIIDLYTNKGESKG